MDAHDNPILRPIGDYADRALTRPSTFSAPPSAPSRPTVAVPPVIGEIIGKLGLRYRPSGAADLEAHAEAIRLLAEDCADIPAQLLDAAAKQWARESKFMPKASELRELARQAQADRIKGSDFALQQLEEHCALLNSYSWVRAKGIRYTVGRDPEGRRMVVEGKAA